ncbi:dffc3560-c60f-40ad-a336-590107e20f2c [Thermothielavioides terrestris]|uniref:Dffc3560-c60f-40ad-a336-590107e20f2c n=1 Tax=Thermothielavioides terrestris TaxID=2587410 RepID=A0A3S4EUL9_9PEZI|nr:dffc3560-c60f-40ad-a336-590107e20f2c [Thermothielavioides terrestris]
MAAMEAANAHYHNGHGQQSGPPLPASPTLTNPDMILPDYDDRSDSPDPDMNRASHPSLMMWKNAHDSSTAGPDIHQMFVATGLAGPRPYGPAGPVTPTTPIIYGNGTMLSDIGEVTEVESTVGKPSPTRTKSGIRRPGSPTRIGVNDVARRSSPTMGSSAVSKKKSKQSLTAKRERRGSMDSDSTITTQDHQGLFADFDDSVSVGDSVFQGDDEESMASSYVEGTAAVEPARPGVAKPDNVDRLSTYSTTSLSRRAEEILANAKRRLTTMEGNLTRARSSLQYTSPYGSDGSTPSPPLQRAATAMYPLANGAGSSASTADSAPGHTRMSSDVAMRNGLPYRVTLPRSQSALGAAGGYRQPLTASRSVDYIRGDKEEESHRRTPIANSLQETGLKPLTEAEVARLGEADSASQNARLEAFLSPTFGAFPGDNGVRTVQRSASAAQMRDIKDQMRDLKGKISSLREQARADSLKRRSLQSLRTPSPFTHAQFDQWYAEPRSNRTSVITTSNPPSRNPWNGEESSVDGDAREHNTGDEHAEGNDTDYFDAEHEVHPEQATARVTDAGSLSPPAPALEAEGEVQDDGSDMLTENGDVDEDQQDEFHDADEADYMSESGESLYHDTVQHQISHEDREDAFDYEHFFLHSALGTMSLRRRASSESLTSEDSVETTRGPVANETKSDDGSAAEPRVWSRRNSSNSISTIDTFATAHEEPQIPLRKHRDNQEAVLQYWQHTPVDLPDGGSRQRRLHLPIAEEGRSSSVAETHASQTSRRLSVIHRPISTASSLHRPSISSFDSVGTNRSFPLVNKTSLPGSKKANSTGVLTPRDSPDQELNTIASRLMSDLGSAAAEQQQHHHGAAANGGGGGGEAKMMAFGPHPLEALLREDKYLVERLVASVGRCVLGLTENGRASAESRMYRRRLNAAMRVLEGFDAADDDAV